MKKRQGKPKHVGDIAKDLLKIIQESANDAKRGKN